MKSIFGWRSAIMLMVFAATTAPVAWAQEEAPAEDPGSRMGNIFFTYEAWVAQPTGLEYTPASYNAPDQFLSSTPLTIPHGTNDEVRWMLEYALPSNWGSVTYTTYNHEDDAGMSDFMPSDFVFGELLAFPLYAGVNNDGLADAFISTSATDLRDWSLEFSRDAFRTPRVAAKWSLGWRRVEHSRTLAASYHALVPGFPVLLPPGPSCLTDPPDECRLEPRPDTATIGSNYEGRGITAGLDLEFPMWKNKLVVEGGITVGAMRGKMNTFYGAETHAYQLDYDGELSILGPPYDEFAETLPDPNDPSEDLPAIDFITQIDYPVSMSTQGTSSDAQVIETELGLRWRTPLERLEVYAGIRQSHYNNVGRDLRPKNIESTVTDDGTINFDLVDVEEVDRSVTYEGFYGGVRIRLF